MTIIEESAMKAVAALAKNTFISKTILVGASPETGFNLNSPNSLLEYKIVLKPIINPLLETVAVLSGFTKISDRVLVADKKVTDQDLKSFLQMIPGRNLIGPKAYLKGQDNGFANLSRASVNRELKEIFALSARLPKSSVNFTDKRGENTNFILIKTEPGRNEKIRFEFFSENLEPVWGVDLGQKQHQSISIHDFFLTEENCDSTIVDVSKKIKLAEIKQFLNSSLLVTSTPGAPAIVEVQAGKETFLKTLTLDPVAAMAEVNRHHQGTPTGVDETVIELAQMQLSGGIGRENYKPYQDHFISLYQNSTHGAICALDTGLGKTVTACGIMKENPTYKALVLAPVGIHGQWEKEINKWVKTLKIETVRSGTQLVETIRKDEFNVIIASPELVSKNINQIGNLKVEDIIFDEVKGLGGDGAQGKALRKLRTQARKGLGLSATPNEKNISDISALAALVRNDMTLLSSSQEYDPEVLGPILFARKKEEVGEKLPQTKVEVLRIEPSEEEKSIHEEILTKIKETARELTETQGTERNKTRTTLMSELALLRATLSDLENLKQSKSSLSSLLDGKTFKATRSQKIAELISSRRGEQFIVCTDHLNSATSLEKELTKRNVKVTILNGELNALERTLRCSAFETGDIETIIITRSGQRGLNLQTASNLIHYDLPNGSNMVTQRNGRAVRIGSKQKEVTIWVPVYNRSADEEMLKLLLPALESREENNVTVYSDESSMLEFVKTISERFDKD